MARRRIPHQTTDHRPVTPVAYARHDAYATGPVRTPAAANVQARRSGKGRLFALIALVVALAVAGALIGLLWTRGVLFPRESTPEDVQRNAEAEIDYGLPTARDLAGADANSLSALAAADGATVYDNTSEEEQKGGGADLVRLAEGVSLADAGAWYLQGIENLPAADAVRFLNGSWRVTLSAGDAYDCRLRYALFNSAGQQEAVDQARAATGLDAIDASDVGTDSYGNTYAEGVYELDGMTYSWRVAACPLSDVYSNEGLPADASYVVVTMRE